MAACVTQGIPTATIQKMFFAESLAVQVSILVHEARHFRGYPHVRCTQGVAAGVEGACDFKYSDGGAYAVGVEYLARVAVKGKNFHPAFKAIARNGAVVDIQNSFVEIPFRANPTLILVDKIDSHLSLAFDQRISDFPNIKIPDGKLLGRAAGANIVPPNVFEEPLYLDFYGPAIYPQSVASMLPGTMMQNYFRNWPEEKRISFVDVLNSPPNQLRLFKDHLEIDQETNIFPFSKEEIPLHFSTALPCVKNSKFRTGKFVVMDSDEIYEIEKSPMQSSNESDQIKTPWAVRKTDCLWPNDIKSVQSLGEKLIGLRNDGKLIVFSPQEGVQEYLLPPHSKRLFKNMIVGDLIPELISR